MDRFQCFFVYILWNKDDLVVRELQVLVQVLLRQDEEVFLEVVQERQVLEQVHHMARAEVALVAVGIVLALHHQGRVLVRALRTHDHTATHRVVVRMLARARVLAVTEVLVPDMHRARLHMLEAEHVQHTCRIHQDGRQLLAQGHHVGTREVMTEVLLDQVLVVHAVAGFLAVVREVVLEVVAEETMKK